MILTVKKLENREENPPQLRETNIMFVFCHVISRAFVRWCSVFDGNPKTVIRRPEEMPCVPQKPNRKAKHL